MFATKIKSMTFQLSKELKVGIVFIIALSVLIWGLMYLKGLEIFQPKKVVFAVYDRVNGLVAANPVTIRGMNVGQVFKRVLTDEPGVQRGAAAEQYHAADFRKFAR